MIAYFQTSIALSVAWQINDINVDSQHILVVILDDVTLQDIYVCMQIRIFHCTYYPRFDQLITAIKCY